MLHSIQLAFWTVYSKYSVFNATEIKTPGRVISVLGVISWRRIVSQISGLSIFHSITSFQFSTHLIKHFLGNVSYWGLLFIGIVFPIFTGFWIPRNPWFPSHLIPEIWRILSQDCSVQVPLFPLAFFSRFHNNVIFSCLKNVDNFSFAQSISWRKENHR